jgi:hypothetical protein
MIPSKKILTGGIQGDIAPQLLGEDELLNVTNGRFAVSEYGRTGRYENVAGTTRIFESVLPPYGISFPIGSAIWEERGWLVYFLYNTSNDHGIYAYDASTGTTYAVFYDSQVSGGLGFSKSHRIDRNIRVIGSLCYWTDDYNEPKKINLESGIKLNHAGFETNAVPYTFLPDSYEITVIRRPPTYAPSIVKSIDDDFENNYIANASWKFAWQYIYWDGEKSVLSMYSTDSKLNSAEEEYNYISVSLSLEEQIPETARIIRLVAIPDNDNSDGIGFAIFTWDKSTDPTPFTSHNSGFSQLSYDYYGDTVGEIIDSSTVVTPYHTVPLLSKTVETAKQRLFLGNNLNGYNTPVATSMTLTAIEGEPGSTQDVNLQWFTLFIYNPNPSFPVVYFGCYLIYIDFATPIGWYYVPPTRAESTVSAPPEGSPPATIDYADLIYMGDDITDAVLYWRSQLDAESGYDGFYSYTNYDFGGDISVTGLEGSLAQSFKSGASYRAGVVFYDKAMRKCGVVTNRGLEILVPDRDYAYTTVVTNIQWVLSSIAAEGEIPDWAYYYAPVRTMNQKTRYFVQSASNKPQYFKIDPATGTYSTTTSDTYVDNESVAIGVDLTYLNQSRMGYTFEEGSGDICILYKDSGEIYKLPVIGQDGKWAYLKVKDLGSFSGEVYLYEIFTPYFKSDTEPYFEVGQLYPIDNPGTDLRAYSVTSGYFYGDVFYVTRTFASVDYKFEGMNPNDDYYQLWNTDAGRINIITLLGQVRLVNEVKWSETYIQGTTTNGLSAFYALNTTQTPQECGPIQKLQLTSKVNAQGTVMLAIHTNQTASLYLGEVQVVDSAGVNAYFASSQNVIGTINVLKGDRGTVHPETTIEYRGLVFWLDANSGAFVQYSENGLRAVSEYGLSRFFKRYCANYLAASSGNIDNINGFHHITTCIDPFNEKVTITLPALIYDNYANQLPSYSSVPSYAVDVINRFDIYDELGKTLTFDYRENKWRENYEYMPEWMDYLNNKMYGFKNGNLYLFDSDTVNWNRFFGVDYPLRICASWNIKEAPSAIKDVYDIALESNVAPDFTVLYATYPWVQITDLAITDYDNPEGVFYAKFLRDRLSPNASGTPDQRLYTGDVVKENCPKVMIEFQQYSELMYVTFINLGFVISRGTLPLISAK